MTSVFFVFNSCKNITHQSNSTSTSLSASEYQFSEAEIDQLCEGDIILRYGKGNASDFIVQTLDEKYEVSHCGIIVRHRDSVYVIHTVSNTLSDIDGIQAQPLNKFLKESRKNSAIVVRYPDAEPRKLAERAVYYLHQKIPFDHSFDLKDTSAFYCSQLVQRVILDCTEENVLADIDNPVKFKAFWDTSDFKMLINHQHTEWAN